MEEKYYQHRYYCRFSTFYGASQDVIEAASVMNLNDYDLTDEDIRIYVRRMNEAQDNFSKLMRKELILWRVVYALCVILFFLLLFAILPKFVKVLMLWIMMVSCLMVLYPFYILYKGLEDIVEHKYVSRLFFFTDPHIEKMVDDYKWIQHKRYYRK